MRLIPFFTSCHYRAAFLLNIFQMNKAAVKATIDPGKTCSSSSFTLTFVVELLGIDVFHDCNEGWLDLGPGPVQGMKLQYVLAPGFLYEAEVMIWPHVAKVAIFISKYRYLGKTSSPYRTHVTHIMPIS